MIFLGSLGEHAVFREALRIVHRQPLPRQGLQDLEAVLDAGRPGTLSFTYEAGMEAGLEHETVVTRSAAIFLLACAVNLADDLADGDCEYLGDGARQGAFLEAILQHLFFQILLEGGISARVLSDVSHDLLRAAGAQRVEMGTQAWRAPVAQAVVDGIGGRVFTAYLRVLWAGTPLAPRAVRVGRHLGRVIVVWEDLSAQDRRYASLPSTERHAVLTWALEAADALREEKLRCLDLLLRGVMPDLQRHLRVLGTRARRRATR